VNKFATLLREPATGARALWLAAAGGLIFCALFYWRYAGIDPGFYQYRDDGIITLSHARNWVDFGFIGVNPSGERIEASSAPLQLLLYALMYGVTHLGYQAFMDLQTLACTFAVGALFALLFAGRPLFALGASVAAAFALTQLPAFMLWHASGMENALFHVFLLWTVLVLWRFAAAGKVDHRWVVIPFFASVVRVDSVSHVAPLLLVFCIYWHARVRDRQAGSFVVRFAGLWLLFNLARYAYFGSLLPNTAVAQGISIGDRLMELVTLSPLYLDQSFSLARANLSRLGGYLLLLALPFIVFRRPARSAVLLLLLAGSLVLTAFFTPFVFGPARLDYARTTTHMALFVVVAVAAALYQWQWKRFDLYAMALAVLVVFLLHEYNRYGPFNACCSDKAFEATRLEFQRIGQEQAIARPTVANPDLGVLSWHKQFNMVDLGLLGSSLVPRLERGAALNNYLLDHAAPDMIETHGWWTCFHAAFLTDRRFAARYVEAHSPGAQTQACKGSGAVPTGIWIRRDAMRASPSAERRLMDALAAQPSVERVAEELRACQAAPGAAASQCAYVARSVYRHLPEFRAQEGAMPRLEEIFQGSRSRDYDLFLLRGAQDGRAWRGAVGYFARPETGGNP
jgi:hypothetical protein